MVHCPFACLPKSNQEVSEQMQKTQTWPAKWSAVFDSLVSENALVAVTAVHAHNCTTKLLNWPLPCVALCGKN